MSILYISVKIIWRKIGEGDVECQKLYRFENLNFFFITFILFKPN